MNPHYADATVTVYAGDCLDVLRELPDASVDAVCTDPPAGIAFMAREWDDFRRARNDADAGRADVFGRTSRSGPEYGRGARGNFVAWLTEVMAEALRVTKPGGHAFVWAIPRTSHWTALAIEDAGWEIRDRVAHHFGSGFPKSHNLPGGLGTALKPATEDWWLARRPLAGTVAANVLAHGTGALNIDGCRVEGEVVERGGTRERTRGYVGIKSADVVPAGPPNPAGRWPANVVLDEHSAHVLDEQSGERPSAGRYLDPDSPKQRGLRGGREERADFLTHADDDKRRNDYAGDQGGASRFFYTAKADAAERVRINGTAHPTVKPLALMRWLVRLVTPPAASSSTPSPAAAPRSKRASSRASAASASNARPTTCRSSPSASTAAATRCRQ